VVFFFFFFFSFSFFSFIFLFLTLTPSSSFFPSLCPLITTAPFFHKTAPQIIIMGVSEFFFIGAIEFFYQQSPERMRSLAAALELVAFGIASYFNTALISVVGSMTDWLPGDWADGNSLLE